jgi:serine protease Do
MRNLARTFSLLFLLGLPAPAPAGDRAAPVGVPALQEAIRQAIERAEPSIACVLVSRSDAYARWSAAPSAEAPGKLGAFDPRPFLKQIPKDDERRRRFVRDHDLSLPDTVPESYGSGVVVDKSGLILTSGHVVQGAAKVYVRLPGGRGSYADIHALDPRSDLAVLRLLAPLTDLRPIALGDGGKVRKGQFVIALANPFAAGFRDGSPSASWGIVSNLRRRAPGNPSEMLYNETERAKITLHHFGTLIQTDARLNLGCSGGALLNLDGELIALTTALAALRGSETPGGFAIPLDANLRQIIDVLKRGEEVEYGFLGVQMDPDPPAGKGARIFSAVPGSPAQRAGLQQGDCITAIDGKPVRESEDLFLLIGAHLAGTRVRLDVVSPADDQVRSVPVTLAKFYVPGKIIASQRPPAPGGLRVDHLSILWQRVPFLPLRRHPSLPQGVVIREVLPNSPAEKAHLQVDKIITHVNGRPVATPADFYREMAGARGQPVKLTYLNAGGRREEQVTIDTR